MYSVLGGRKVLINFQRIYIETRLNNPEQEGQVLPMPAVKERLYPLWMWGLQCETVYHRWILLALTTELSFLLFLLFVLIDFVCVYVILCPFDWLFLRLSKVNASFAYKSAQFCALFEIA